MRHFLHTNCTKATPIVVKGKEIKFYPAVYMQGTGTEWGTYSTDDKDEIEALTAKGVAYVSEISAEDLAAYDAQRKKRVDYSTIFNHHHQGIGSEVRSSPAAVVIDDPSTDARAAQVEAADDILATKVSTKKAR